MTKKQTINNVDKNKLYSAEEAAKLVKSASTSKFVGSVDIDILFDLTEKQKKEIVSGSTSLPNKVGSDVRVAVVADGEDQTKAQTAGADSVGYKDLIAEIEKGKVEFDVLIATPAVMRDLARLGKVLGPRGLMPNPKNETVTTDLPRVIASYKAGKLNFKSTEQKTIRVKIGTVDMTPEQIAENITAFVTAVLNESKKISAQPFKKITVSPTMGAGIRLDTMQFYA